MYEMYPAEWGPSRHRTEPSTDDRTGRDGTVRDSRGGAAVQSALDLRDNGGPRPDDN